MTNKRLIDIVGTLDDFPEVIYAARHGQCPHNRDKWLAGQSQEALTEQGIKDGLNLRRILIELDVKPDVVVSTGLLRALHTALFALNLNEPRRDEDGRVLYDPTGFPKIKVSEGEPLYNDRIYLEEPLEERNFGDGFYRKSRDVYDVKDVHFRPEGGESLRDVFRRVEYFASDRFKRICSGKQSAAFFIHGSTLGFLNTILQGRILDDITNPGGKVNNELINTKPGTLYVLHKDLEKGCYNITRTYH